ncbi:MAG: helix-turn-helix domain-containing protein [Candidatus Nanoarchaeia archaeon]|nr:helix-turn-helix domain-containing protein [Candidatus Nanoarchaeia archaeon]
METEELINIGLTQNQAEIYLEILKHPGQSGGKIAKMVSLDRSFTYGIINSLIDKGLVNYTIKEKVREYSASDPENLLKEIDEKKNKITEIVQELKSMRNQKKSEKSVLVYEGKAGLKALARDIISSDFVTTIGGGDSLKIFEELKYEYPHYLKEIKERKIKGRLITSPKNKDLLKKDHKNSEVEIKSFEGLKSKVSFTIFRNKLAIYSAEDKPFVIIIEDQNIASSFKTYFDKTWNFAR